MSVSAVGASSAPPVAPKSAAKVDAPRDDDAAKKAPAQAAPAPGTGTKVNKSA